MPKAIFPLVYFGSIRYFKELVRKSKVYIEAQENFQKQTYRNRQFVYGANGKLMLNIPVKHSKSSKRIPYKECVIDNSFKWKINHFKSLETAYRTSPYFEFYEADIRAIFSVKNDNLFEFNLNCFQTMINLIQINITYILTKKYNSFYQDIEDNRYLASAKTSTVQNKSINTYHQVFEDKHGFIPNLSILDLLFNVGPESLSYLQS